MKLGTYGWYQMIPFLELSETELRPQKTEGAKFAPSLIIYREF